MGEETKTASRGRPLDPKRRAEILDVAASQLVANGYESLHMKAVAAEVGCSVATIYRRWPSKADLVIDAIRQISLVESVFSYAETVEPTGDPLADLHGLASTLVDSITGGLRPDRTSAVIATMHADPAVRQAVLEAIIEPTRDLVNDALRAVLGVDHPMEDFLVDVIPAQLFFQTVFDTDVAMAPDDMADRFIELVAAVADRSTVLPPYSSRSIDSQ